MSNTQTAIQPQKVSFFAKWFYKLLEKHLPRSFKRLIYVSSILGLFEQTQDPDMTLVVKLNETFKLAQYPDAFAFPMYIKSVIWKNAISEAILLKGANSVAIGDLIKMELNSKECSTIGEYFAKQSPTWLKYGSLDLMANDIVLLIKQLKLFKASTASMRAAV